MMTNAWPVTFTGRKFLPVDDRWFQTYVTDVLEPMTKYYVKQRLYVDAIELPYVSAEWYKCYKTAEQKRPVAISTES